MLNWIKNNKLATAGIAIVLIYVIVSLIKKEWNPLKWFSGISLQRTYNVGKCCKSDNPCGWSSATFNSQCTA